MAKSGRSSPRGPKERPEINAKNYQKKVVNWPKVILIELTENDIHNNSKVLNNQVKPIINQEIPRQTKTNQEKNKKKQGKQESIINQ